MKRSTIAALLATGLLVGCQGDQPTAATDSGPSAAIFDGSRGGNPGFFFLPPIADNPGDEPLFDADLFNRNLSPVVEICALSAGPDPACVGEPVSRFSGDDITISSNHYGVEWDTHRLGLDLSTNYRIQVFVSTVLLGYADVDIVRSNRDKQLVDTQNFVPLQRGKTLPIKFHIEFEAFCETGVDCVDIVVGGNGGTVTTPSGDAGASFPDGWLPDGIDQVLVIIERIDVPNPGACLPSHWLVQFAGCYSFTTIPDLGTFEGEVVVGVCPDFASGGEFADMGEFAQLMKFDEEDADPEDPEASIIPLEVVPAPFLSCNDDFDRDLGGLVTSFSKIDWAVDAEIVILDGENQSGTTGTTLPVAPLIQINTLYPRTAPWSDVTVRFRFVDPDDNIISQVYLITDKLGRASAPWTVVGVGTNRLGILAHTLPSRAVMVSEALDPAAIP